MMGQVSKHCWSSSYGTWGAKRHGSKVTRELETEGCWVCGGQHFWDFSNREKIIKSQ